MLDTKELPDSVRCRHILLGTTNPQTGQQTGNDSLAHKIADSIAMVISKGGNFDTLETQFTTDQVAHKDKGVMTFSSDQIQGEGFAKEFGQFILFDGKPGDKKVVKTSFGWHYIEILGFIKPETHYKVAYMAKAVVPSSETDRDANNTASQFASDSRSLKSFDVNFEKNLKPKGLNKMFGNDIKPNDYEVMGIGTSRQFVKDIYSADMGDVMQPERIGDQYVVAAITEINKEGTAGVTKARSYVEPILRNKKKAELVEKKTGKITTLEAAAATLGKQIETKDSLRMTTGFDIKITGATFNPANKSKVVSELIEGSGALFVLRVDNVTATALETANVSEQQKTMYQSSRQGVEYPDPRNPGYPINVLRRAATIKDNRAKFY
jgi:peptidyl-prolyl cis-trans isomerase D